HARPHSGARRPPQTPRGIHRSTLNRGALAHSGALRTSTSGQGRQAARTKGAPMPGYVVIREAAHITGCTVAELTELIYSGALPNIRFGRGVIEICTDDLVRLV